jgi:hydrogenase maturation protease
MTDARGALVLGIGNVLLRDEGVGVVVARRIEAARAGGDPGVPAETRVVDGGTLGLDLLPMIGEADQVVIVDAVNLGRPPGTVSVLRDASVQAALSGHVSPHQIGVGDLVAAARLMGTMPRRLTLIGIQPGEIAVGLELTEPVAAAIDEAIELVRRELAAVLV